MLVYTIPTLFYIKGENACCMQFGDCCNGPHENCTCDCSMMVKTVRHLHKLVASVLLMPPLEMFNAQ